MYNHIDRVINFALQYSIYPPAYPMEIGEIILRIYPEQNLLTSAILYSTIDHSSHKNISKGLKQIRDYFGPHIAYKISNITKFSNYEYIAYDLTKIYKFTSALNLVDKTTNSTILLIKLAILLHSLSVFNNYYSLSHEQIKLISLDILEVYLPLISVVDIEDLKTELQEFCTKILYPDINKDIKKYLGVIESSEEFLNDIVEDLNKELSNSQIKATVSGRIKSYYSIWRKLHYKNTTIEQLNDIIGLRIIVDNTDDCYFALKVIHRRYQSLPKKFHDFINIPKGNGYKSLHTVIVGPKSQKLEVQIRTTEMHQVAQHGSAAHWQYKHDFTKILSVFIAAQKLYTKPTVNLATPNSVTQHNNSNVNANITVANIQLNTLGIHMSAIGLLATDNNKQGTNDKVATDENQYITSQQTEYADSCIAVQSLAYGFMNLLFKFMQDNVYDQIMIFIVGSDVANLVNISVEVKECKTQESWDNNYNINGNKQNSKHVSSYLEKEVVVISSNSDAHSNRLQMLVEINSAVTENIDTAKTTTLTNMESNSNKLNSEQTTQEEKQEMNPTQNTFGTTSQVSNISDNTTNITNFYKPELQDESVKFTNDGIQYFQLPLNTTAVSEAKEDNTYLEYNSANEGNIMLDSENKTINNEGNVVLDTENKTTNNEGNVMLDSENKTTNVENKTLGIDPLFLRNDPVDNIGIEEDNPLSKLSSTNEGDNEGNVVLDSENKTTNIENKTSSIDPLFLSNDTVNVNDNHECIAATHIKDKGTNSTNITKEHTIKSHRYAIKIFCAIIKSKEFERQLQDIIESTSKTPRKMVKVAERYQNILIHQSVYDLLNSYESIYPEKIDLIAHSVANTVVGTLLKNEKQKTFITNRISHSIYRGRQILTGIALVKHLAHMLPPENKYKIFTNLDLFIYQCKEYIERYIGSQNVPKVYEDSIKDIESLKEVWCNHAEIEITDSAKTNYSSDNESNEDKYDKFLDSVHSGNCIKVYKTVLGCSGVKEYLSYKDEVGNTPILVAIARSNFLMVMILLSNKITDLHVENERHDTPLSLAFTSDIINKCIINILMQEIIIKYEKQLSTKNENFTEFITSSKEFKQFYNACRSYAKKFASIMIIDLLVEMNIVSPELMRNLVVGLYYKSYIDGDCEFSEYLKCIGCIDTDTAEADCNIMMLNDYIRVIGSQPAVNSTVPESYSIRTIEDIKKLLKCFYVLRQSEKQLLVIDQMMIQHFQRLEIEGKKVIDIEEMLKQWKCQSDVDCDAALTTLSTIRKYIKIVTMMIMEYNSKGCNIDEMQESHSNQHLMKHCKLLDKCLLEWLKEIVEVMTRPPQPPQNNGDDDESITKDANALHTLCKEIVKVRLLAKTLMADFVGNDKNIPTKDLTEQYEKMLKSTDIVKLADDVCTFITLDPKDFSLFDRKALPAPSDTKILPEYSIIEFLRYDKIINAADRESIMQEVNNAMTKGIDNSQQRDDMKCILSHVDHEIGLKNADSILAGEQHDSYNDHDNI